MKLDFEYLEQNFLPYVEKPDRYIGNEINLPELTDDPQLRVVLAFPDLYELGMSYLGLRILLHLGNSIEGVACERVFMPWFDAVERLRSLNIPLFSLESKTPLRGFDLIGFNLQYELHATNILAMLDLAGIPLRSDDRTGEDPVIIAGGPLTANPEPFAPFFDAVVIGDGEDVFPELLELFKKEKGEGSDRNSYIRKLGNLPGIYLPSFYDLAVDRNGNHRELICRDSNLPRVIQTRIAPELLPRHYPRDNIIPVLEPTHNRYVMEISRGCSKGCRFCEPGMTGRPVRERPVADLVKQACEGLTATGYSDLSLLSLSTADYRYLDELLDGLDPVLTSNNASLSFPSLRPDRFTPQMAERASKQKRTGLTFAPEAATPRLRAVINKQTTDEAILDAARLAFEKGWQLIKLYFMIGLPTETDEDVQAIVDLVKKIGQIKKPYRNPKINVSVSPFSPKPHTPFEREGQLPPDEIRRRIAILKEGFKGLKSVKLELRPPEVSRVEMLIGRGDRRYADAIEACYRAGGLFDAWTDGFSAHRWQQAFSDAGIDVEGAIKPIPSGRRLPWSHIDVGISVEFLQEEIEGAEARQFTPDCRDEGCRFCGLHEKPEVPCPDILELPVEFPALSLTDPGPENSQLRYRLVYKREGPARFSSHLDVIGVLKKALRRSQVPLEFTKGFRPHLRISTSPPLGTGICSSCELLDIGTSESWTKTLTNKLNEALPFGIDVIDVVETLESKPSIGALNAFLYKANPRRGSILPSWIDRIEELMNADSIPILRTGPKGARAFDARSKIWKLQAEDDNLLIGVRSTQGPLPRIHEILPIILEDNGDWKELESADIIAGWNIVRTGMWWYKEGNFLSPIPDLVAQIVSD
jgi:radical SAM family uncharacterized protein/radical SAM-linked protein